MKKGFTLIELLAVIVILAIIALIAAPIVLNIMEKARRGAAKASAVNYIRTVETDMVDIAAQEPAGDSETKLSINMLNQVLETNKKLTGKKPTSGYITIGKNYAVVKASLIIDGYIVKYDGKNYTVTKREVTSTPNVVYSRVNAGTHIGYPIAANTDMGNKYVHSYKGVDMPFNTLEECKTTYDEECVLKKFKTPDLDYKEIPDASWNYYLKHTLNTSGIIEEIELCGIHDEQEFCLKRNDYENNKLLLQSVFDKDNCEINEPYISCYNSLDLQNAGAGTHEDGLVGGFSYPEVQCAVTGSGSASCIVKEN